MRLSVVASALAALLIAPATGHAQAASVEIQVPEVRVDAQTPPPAARVEVQPAPPAPGHVWLAGHWRWEHGAYVWVPGHWARPPGQGDVWVPAEWAQRGGVWYFREGHWKAPSPAGVYTPPPAAAVTVQQAPPTAVAEVRPTRCRSPTGASLHRCGVDSRLLGLDRSPVRLGRRHLVFPAAGLRLGAQPLEGDVLWLEVGAGALAARLRAGPRPGVHGLSAAC